MRPLYVTAFIFLAFLNVSRAFADESYLPHVFGMITKSKAEEALASLSNYKAQVEVCLQAHPAGAKTSCAGLSPFASTLNFTYAFSPDTALVDNAANSTDNYTIVATPTEAADAQNGSVIELIRNNDTFTCQATGSFIGVC